MKLILQLSQDTRAGVVRYAASNDETDHVVAGHVAYEPGNSESQQEAWNRANAEIAAYWRLHAGEA